MRPTRNRRWVRFWSLALLAALIALGLAMHVLEPIDWRAALEWARGYASRWWLPPALVALQAVLFMFALPGSAMLWLVAPLYAPAASALILAAGGTLGGLAAYGFARRLTDEAVAQLRASRGYRTLERESDFLMLCALRLLPAFPHSVINYGAGLLRLPVARFVAASVIGLGVKAYVYSSVVHHALDAARPADLLRPESIVPLALIALALIAGRLLRRRPGRRGSDDGDPH